MLNTHIRDNENSLRSEHFSVQRFRGLHLRTHPDADVAATNVMLVHADEIVMDDGTRLGPWDRISANVAASGAGGLDAGSEASLTWYEIYAIAKDDGTKNLLLHRAKDYFLDEEYAIANADTNTLLRDAAARTSLAQGFKVDTAGKVECVDLYVGKVGAPTGQVWAEIRSDDGAGKPSGTVLATSDKMDVGQFNTGIALIRFIFRNPTSLTATTQYHLVLTGSFTISGTNHFLWRGDATSPTYANGSKASFDGSAWTLDSTFDFVFRVYVTRNDTAVTMPSAYTKKALIGHVFNDAGSNFLVFLQRDADVRMNPVGSGTFTNTFPNLLNMVGLGYMPPIPVSLMLGAGNSVVGNSVVVQPVPNGYADATLYSMNRASFAGSSTISSALNDLFTEMQAVYSYVDAGTGQFYVFGYKW